MNLKRCDKCGEDVDEAKAFCPECGNPFVHEEKRTEATEFEKQAGTVAYSKTMFNMMLSKMDLDTSRPPEEEKKTQPPQVVQPSEQSPQKSPTEEKKKSGMIKWIIIAAAGAMVLVLILIAVLAILYVYYYRLF